MPSAPDLGTRHIYTLPSAANLDTRHTPSYAPNGPQPRPSPSRTQHTLHTHAAPHAATPRRLPAPPRPATGAASLPRPRHRPPLSSPPTRQGRIQARERSQGKRSPLHREKRGPGRAREEGKTTTEGGRGRRPSACLLLLRSLQSLTRLVRPAPPLPSALRRVPFVTHQPPQLCPPARLQGVLDFALLPNILCQIYIELLVVHVPIIEYSVTAGISDYILNQSHAHQPAGMISSSRDEMVSDKRSR